MAKIIDMKLDGETVVVNPQSFLGNLFGNYRAACGVGGARFDPKRKANVTTIDRVADLAQALRREGFELAVSEALRTLVVAQAQEEARVEAVISAEGEAVAAGLATRGLSLYPFQVEGVSWLRNNRRALFTDQMGLGKTVQIACAMAPNVAAVVVCPASLKLNWRKELALWRPELEVVVLSGRAALKVWPKPGQVFVMNYDILGDELPAGEVPAGLTVVGDEIHACKNYEAKRSVRMTALMKVAAVAWGLTGTPLMNRPFELWGVLGTLGIGFTAFGSFSNFVRLFGGRKEAIPGQRFKTRWAFYGAPSAQVETCLRRVSFGRRRDDVLPDLPKKSYQTIDVEIDAKTAKLCDKVMKALEEAGIDLEKVMGMVAGQVEQHRERQDAECPDCSGRCARVGGDFSCPDDLAAEDFERRAYGSY